MNSQPPASDSESAPPAAEPPGAADAASAPKHPAAARSPPPAKRARAGGGGSGLVAAFGHVLASENYKRSAGTAGWDASMSRAGSTLLVHGRQRGNPVLKWIRQVTMDIVGELGADFVCGKRTGVLYLSLKFHCLNPGYIYGRVREMSPFEVRVLLVVVDVGEWAAALRELSKLALLRDLVLVCASSLEEAGRYLEMFRALDMKTADAIQERTDEDYASRLHRALSSVRAVNKTDAATLAFNFGPLKNLANASIEELRACPGIGERKVARLHAALNQPFLKAEEWRTKKSDASDSEPDS